MEAVKLKDKLMNALNGLVKAHGIDKSTQDEEELNSLLTEIGSDYQNAAVDNKNADKKLLFKQSIIKAIKYRNNILQVSNKIAERLVQSVPEDFSASLYECMKMMAETVNVDRVYLWKNHVKNEELYATQIYEWSEDANPQQDNEYTVDIPYRKAYPELVNLAVGNTINNIVKLMAEASKRHLEAQDVVSVLIKPIFLKGKFWGFVGFDDCHRERIFTKEEEMFLQSSSFLIANILLRNEAFLAAKESSNEAKAALELAKSANKAKSDFLSKMSHEIRTPMNAIIGMAKIGRRKTSLKDKNEALGTIKDASKHLLGIINDVLDMSKIEANKLELSPVEFNIAQMLQKVRNIINFEVQEKGLNFQIDIDKDIPNTVVGDDQRLTQVITNLLSNAIKFTPKGGTVRLEIKRIKEDDEKCFIQIDVHDTGIGISEEQKERLFNSFEQASSGTTRKYGGTGLGLAISKSIVEKMDGEIWVKSVVNGGSTFSFTASLGRTKKIIENMPEDNNQLPDFSGHTILLAEDVLINSEIVSTFLLDTNMEIEVAENGQIAVDKFQADPDKYDLILMDIQMPEMDGHEATRIIRNLKFTKAREIPIIAMSANVFKEEIEYCLANGMNDHIGKPIDFDTVLAVLAKYLEDKNKKTSEGPQLRMVRGSKKTGNM